MRDTFINGKSLVKKFVAAAGLCAAVFASPSALAGPLDSSFTYQGKLSQANSPVTSSCDFRFRLYDAVSGGTQIGAELGIDDTTPDNGLITVSLDFGLAAFQGDGRYLEIDVRSPAGSGTWTTLAPRQTVAAAPYALWALNSEPGPVGPQGPVGPVGPQGPAGNDGLAGPAGPVGPVGPQGPAGSNGTVGPAGPAGPMGPQGPAGSNGPTGPAGPAGPMGPQGPAGTVGPQGPAGNDGAVGPTGPAGPVGPQGATGVAGPIGPIGLTGPIGPAGPQGPAGATGPAGPQGPTGPAGAQGATGPQGPAGPQGDAGLQGAAGPQGATGPQGPTGPTGPTGPSGIVSATAPLSYDANTKTVSVFPNSINAGHIANRTRKVYVPGASFIAGPNSASMFDLSNDIDIKRRVRVMSFVSATNDGYITATFQVPSDYAGPTAADLAACPSLTSPRLTLQLATELATGDGRINVDVSFAEASQLNPLGSNKFRYNFRAIGALGAVDGSANANSANCPQLVEGSVTGFTIPEAGDAWSTTDAPVTWAAGQTIVLTFYRTSTATDDPSNVRAGILGISFDYDADQ